MLMFIIPKFSPILRPRLFNYWTWAIPLLIYVFIPNPIPPPVKHALTVLAMFVCG